MSTNKRASSIALNTIIIAILALVVLLVTIAILTGKVNLFSQSTETCYSKGGKCLDSIGTDSCSDETVTMYTKDCQFIPRSDKYEGRLGQCCVKLG